MNNNVNDNGNRKYNTIFNIKDLIMILTPLIAIASAFFAYDTRISVLETHNENMKTQIDDLKKQIGKNSARYHKLELDNSEIRSKLDNIIKNQQDIEDYIGKNYQ